MYPAGWKNQMPLTSEQMKLHFDKNGTLQGEQDSFYPEIYISFKIPVPENLPEEDLVLIDAISGSNGWQCILTMQGRIRLVKRSDGKIILETRPAIGILDIPELHIELLLSNIVWPLRSIEWQNDDPLDYSRAEVFINDRMLSDINMREPDIAVVPLCLKTAGVCFDVEIYNTVRRALFMLPDDPGGPVLDTEFPDASRAFGRYDSKTGIYHLFTGAEFIRSDSYWLFCRLTTSGGQIRVYPTEFDGAPMAPVYFRSRDRKTWVRCKQLDCTDESGRNRPLIYLPEGTWYLSTSIPFMKQEQELLFKKFGKLPDFEVAEIGKSTLGHPISLLRAGHGEYRIFFIIGQHSPMEMLGCHILVAMLEQFAADPALRERFTLYAIPPLNMDAAVSGGDGWNSLGWNTNRCWFENLQPETRAVEDFLRQSGFYPDIFIDWHAGGVWRGHTVLYYDDEIVRKYADDKTEKTIALNKMFRSLLEKECGFRHSEQFSFPYRNCCAHDWVLVNFPESVSVTIELSVTTCFDPEKNHYIKVDQESLYRYGAGMIRVICAMEENCK